MPAIKGAITSTGYNSNHVTVEIKPDIAGLVIKPANLLSRAINQVSSSIIPAWSAS